MKELGYDVIGRHEGRKLMKRDGFRRYAMNSSLRRNLVIAGALSLVVIALIVGALRPKHASGAGRERLRMSWWPRSSRGMFRFTANGSVR